MKGILKIICSLCLVAADALRGNNSTARTGADPHAREAQDMYSGGQYTCLLFI